ncbi:nitroreductase family protein [Streptomyces cyanogenus]|uniref:Nitroreductase family protein n=1 Tax=Streptomyces cyanogenus TaxID=80860 RepID=A0ABX7U5B0_STRCY|nr:nitroreductase family protein [Streptomyces cyanogenus]QTE03037.1 Nitroreductase family protein [Streptomyces cyanogenus]
MTAIERPTRPTRPTESPGARYWHRSLHDYAAMIRQGPGGREGRPADPERFTRFGDLPRYPLPPPPRALGALGRCLGPWHAGPGTGGPPPVPAPSAAFYSALLHYSCGVFRTEFGPTARWPYHRAVPSARCFAPVETYLWTPGHDEVPAGVYAYDPAHHTLVLLRAGDFGALLGAALGADIADAVGVLLLSTVFWRTAFRYGAYAYRLCAQESGLVAGNALMVAGALGAQGHLHHQFLDGPLERLTGVARPDESIAAVLALYPGREDDGRPILRSPAPHTEAALSAAIGPVTGRPAPPVTAVRSLGDLVAVDTAARLTGTAAFARLPHAVSPVPRAAGGAAVAGELADCLRRRTSGAPVFHPERRPVPLDAVLGAVGAALAPFVSDAVPDGSAPPVRAHVWAVDVTGAEDGLYEMTEHGLRHLGSVRIADLGLAAPNIHYRTVNAVVFLSVPREQAQAAFGDRGFRVLHHEAGVVAQRLCVLSTVAGLAARVHNGYTARAVADALRLPPGHEPVFQIALGTPGADERYLMPVPEHLPQTHGGSSARKAVPAA